MSATTLQVVSFCAAILFYISASVQATDSSNIKSKASLKSNATTNNNTGGRKGLHVDEEWGGGAGEWVNEGDKYYIQTDVPVKPSSSAVYWPGRSRSVTVDVVAVDDMDAPGAAMFFGAERSRSGGPDGTTEAYFDDDNGDDSDYDRKKRDFDRK
ncbi:hypothetical protein HPB47_023070 [Ixodes persulcatus]|uniref:Uncharacterized protein n=1 Tax=Ixodes persulcatus TaxID=34615 RepID=A0AC60Q7Z6_IXOPE|nr:hypothetical protein HPB47_023070 [Ixodes persulcatus]